MVVYLDAPADVLLQRKQEHSAEILEQQRQRYLSLLQGMPGAIVVDARPEAEQVRRAVTAAIWRRYAASIRGG
jgi:thymidylate kinase